MFTLDRRARHGSSGYEFMCRLYQAERVSVIDGGAFGSETRGFVRLCFATDEATLREAIVRIRRYVGHFERGSHEFTAADFGIVVRTAGRSGDAGMERAAKPRRPGAAKCSSRAASDRREFHRHLFSQGRLSLADHAVDTGRRGVGSRRGGRRGCRRILKRGDRVAYMLPIGAYRTRRVVPAERLVKLPDAIDFEVAASLMLKGMTAQFLLNSCYAVKAGETVLVHAAAGGVGLLMGQWLKALGAISIGTVGSPEKVATAQAPTATPIVIDYRAEDFAARVKEITGGRGCDVVYDSVGHDTWRGSLKCLRTRGMFVCFGQSSGPITDFKFSDLAAGGSLYRQSAHAVRLHQDAARN